MSEDLLELYILGRMMKEEDFIHDNMDYWQKFDEFLNIKRFSNFIQNRKFLSSEFGINFIVKDFKGFDEFKNLNLVLLVLEEEENMDFSGLENLVVAEGTSIYYHARPFYQAHTGGQTYTYDEEEEKIFMDNWEELLKSASKINSFTKEIFYLGQYQSQSDIAIIKERKRWRELLTKYDRFDENGEIVNPDVYMSLEQNHNTYIVTQEFNLIKLDEYNYKIFYTFPFDKSENTGFDYNIMPMIKTKEILIDGEEMNENEALKNFQTIEFIISKKDYEEYLELYKENLENMWASGPEAYRLARFYNPLMTISFSDEKNRENVLINLIPENEYINIAYDINNPNDEYDIELKGSLPEGAVFNEESMRPFYLVNKKIDGKTNIDNIELEKAGYKFNGWSNEKTGKNWDFKRDKTDKSMTLLANWIPEEKVEEMYVNVTFVPNNGDDEYTLLLPKNRQITEPNVLKEGYEFKGWSKSETEVELWDFNEKVGKDIILYAKWEKIKENPIDPVKPVDPKEPQEKEDKPSKKKRKKTEEVIEDKTEIKLNKKDHLAYLKGYEDKTIRAEGNLSREEASMVFYRLLDKDYRAKIETKEHNFKDIENGRWSEEAIATLSKAGMIKGYEDGNFKPEEKITRAEISAMISKLTETKVMDTKFKDAVEHWAEEYINSAQKQGWINGYEDGSFRPDDKIKRSEFAKIINTLLERKVEKENILKGIKDFKDLFGEEWYYTEIVEATNGHKYEIKDNKEIWLELDNREFK